MIDQKMSDILYITEDGLQKLKQELDHLRLVERPAISRMIAEARDKGDLTENAEYSAAKEAQGMLEMKISKLEDTIARSRLLDESKIDTSTVRILNRVKIKNRNNGMVMEYQIVPESEANLKMGKLAVNSPIAMGLIGKKVGEMVQIKVPSGVIPFEILSIST
jgi:transcription elongation factor GreA